jgi:hypothetical protein
MNSEEETQGGMGVDTYIIILGCGVELPRVLVFSFLSRNFRIQQEPEASACLRVGRAAKTHVQGCGK